MSHALSNTYKFNTNGLISDFNALDTFNGSQKNGCIGSEAIYNYIDAFDEEYDIASHKGLIQDVVNTFLNNDTKYINKEELEFIIYALNGYKKLNDKDNQKQSYNFNQTDFQALDTYNGYADNDLIGEEAIRNYLEAVVKHYNFNEGTKDCLEWLIEQYLKEGCENAITKNEFGSISSGIDFVNFLNNLLASQKQTDRENDNKPYKFNRNDFEALDTYNGYADNDLIGEEAITNYVNKFIKKHNLSDADRKIIDRVIQGFFAGGDDNAISKREFDNLLKVLESLRTDECNDKNFNRTFKELDKYESSTNGLIGKEAITNYVNKFVTDNNIDNVDKIMINRIIDGFLTDGIDNAVSKREFQVIWELLESMKKPDTSSLKQIFDDEKISDTEYARIQKAYKEWVKSEEEAGRHRSASLEEAKANKRSEIFQAFVRSLGLTNKERSMIWDRVPVTTKEHTFRSIF